MLAVSRRKKIPCAIIRQKVNRLMESNSIGYQKISDCELDWYTLNDRRGLIWQCPDHNVRVVGCGVVTRAPLGVHRLRSGLRASRRGSVSIVIPDPCCHSVTPCHRLYLYCVIWVHSPHLTPELINMLLRTSYIIDLVTYIHI